MSRQTKTMTRNDKPWLDYSFSDIFEFYKKFLGDAKTAEEHKEFERHLCRNDLYYLLVFGLEQKHFISPDHNSEWLYERCREVEKDPDGYIDLWAREHYKSSIITFGKTIQDILVNPEITFGIFSHTKDQSRVFVRQIKETLQSCVQIKYLFPDILWEKPESQAPAWSDEALVVKREGLPKEPTVMACGLVNGMPTGMHFHRRIYEDIITETMVSSPEVIKKVTDCIRNSTNLGRIGGAARFIGTRYHMFDPYHTIMAEGIAKPRIHAATSDGKDDTRKSVFMPPDVLEKKRKEMGSLLFACQMLQNPKADDMMGFKRENLLHWDGGVLENLNFVILCDPAGSRDKVTNTRQKSDYTAFIVVGLGGDDNFYIPYMLRARLSLTGRADVLFGLHRRFSKIAGRSNVWVGYEKYGCQADIEHFETRMKRENYRFKILELGGITSKLNRINRLHPLFEDGRIYLPETCLVKVRDGGVDKMVDMVKTFIEEEYVPYPVLQHDDMLDALSRICDEEIVRIPRPEAVDDGWNALRELEQRERENEPVV